MRRTPQRAVFAALALSVLYSCGQPPASPVQETLPPGSPYAGGAQYPWTDKLESPVADPYAAGRDYPWKSAVGKSGLQEQALVGGRNYLSDLPWTSATNGWGPVERDLSNGEMRLGDGKALTLRGYYDSFKKGLGVHADSDVRFALNGQCKAFSADVGLDTEVGGRGRVAFRVVGDGKTLYDSGWMTGTDNGKRAYANIEGVKELSLQVLKGENNYYDHADWADASVSCLGEVPVGDVTLSDLGYTSAENGWGPVEMDRSNGEQGHLDGRPLTLAGQVHTRGLGVHAPASLNYALNGQCSALTAQLGLDDEVGAKGSVVFQVYGDGKKLFDSGVVRGSDAALPLNVNLSGVKTLTMSVTEAGDGKAYDHADWASAKLTCADREAAFPVVTGISGNVQDRDPNTGLGLRNPLTITGQNLQGAAVYFRGLPGTDVKVSPDGTSLTVLPPVEAPGLTGHAAVVVETLGGAANAGVYTYTQGNMRPLVDLLTLSPAEGPASGGTPVTITFDGDVTYSPVEQPYFDVPLVYFGNVQATDVKWGPRDAAGRRPIIAVAPAGTGWVYVSLKCPISSCYTFSAAGGLVYRYLP